jgi:hypothetical protein
VGKFWFIAAAALSVAIQASSIRARPECEKLAKNGVQAGGEGTLWSDAKTWTGGQLPSVGDIVVIPTIVPTLPRPFRGPTTPTADG